jgi:hypothetical protein
MKEMGTQVERIRGMNLRRDRKKMKINEEENWSKEEGKRRRENEREVRILKEKRNEL